MREDGKSYVKERIIKIKLNVYEAYHQYINDTSNLSVRYGEGNISENNYESYSSEKILSLSGGDGEKEIVVQLRDEAGNESIEYRRVIVLDTINP